MFLIAKATLVLFLINFARLSRPSTNFLRSLDDLSPICLQSKDYFTLLSFKQLLLGMLKITLHLCYIHKLFCLVPPPYTYGVRTAR